MGVKKRILLLLLVLGSGAGVLAQKPAESRWVRTDGKGKLTYATLEKGDRILDFSYAGYGGGGVVIPSPSVTHSLSPVPGDNTDNIQQAIDEVSKRPLVNGFRGVVLLKPGTYDCERTLTIRTSGVVLRGSGSDSNGTVLRMTGKPHNCISVRGEVRTTLPGIPTQISDAYVPSGAMSFHVRSTNGFSVGDTIRIVRPVTASWVHFMGMDSLKRDGKPQTWITGETFADRVIRRMDKNLITVDLPLTDSYDATYLDPPGVRVSRLVRSGEITNIGLESLCIVSAPQSVTISEGHNRAFSMDGVSDGWARDLQIYNTVNSVSITGRRITVDGVHIVHEQPTLGAAKPADLNGSGAQLLFTRCTIRGDNLFFFGTGAKVSGPVVLLHCTFLGNGWIQPHQRWATGLLIDNCQVPQGGIDFMNRGAMGSGHGWAIGWAVAWNCTARSYLNQQPPGAANWVIGSQGERQQKPQPFDQAPLVAEGLYDSHGTAVAPASLYLAQLKERLGARALANIGYGEGQKETAVLK